MFDLRVDDSFPKHDLFARDAKGICLEATVFLPSAEPLYEPHICIVHQMDALEECAQPHLEDASGKELLYAFISILKANYSHVTHINLRDTSYIPSNRKQNALDLLSYSIGLYGKTWYERVAGAYVSSPSMQNIYEHGITTYRNPMTKNTYTFADIMRVISRHNEFARQYMQPRIILYETMYNEAHTFSEFFQNLKQTVDPANACRFFKEWLDAWVLKFVEISRDWTIPIDENNTLLEMYSTQVKKSVRKSKRADRNS